MLSDAGMQSDDEIDISEVIDWDEAMEQVAGDEEFLLELLNDLQEELSAQIIKISIAMNPVRLLNIRSAAHVVKGAAANLFCKELRSAAFDLEMTAKNADEERLSAEIQRKLEENFQILKIAAKNYETACKKIV